MFLYCPYAGLPDNPENRANVVQLIRAKIARMDEPLKIADNVGDTYRKAGVLYHGTFIAARQPHQPHQYHPTSLEDCEAFFELTRPEEFKAIFRKFHHIIAALVDLRSRHVRYSGTYLELCHRFDIDIDPPFNELMKKLTAFAKGIFRASATANILDGISENTLGGRGLRAWYHAHMESSGPEYTLFRNWISCLPETERAMAAGQFLLDIASDLIYKSF